MTRSATPRGLALVLDPSDTPVTNFTHESSPQEIASKLEALI